MATKRQIEANRLNAQKSTGPRTLQGKAISCFNALKTGIDAISEIIKGEDYDELAVLALEYHERWQPALPEQRCLVDILVNGEWVLRRLRKAEAQLWAHVETQYCIWDGRKTNGHQGAVLERSSQEFARLQRRITAIEKSYHLNLAKLEEMAAQAPAAADPVQPVSAEPIAEPQSEIATPPEPPIGFVPQVAPKRAAAAVAHAENDPLGAATTLPQPEISMEIHALSPFSPVV